ncbi:MAG: sialidase family protein [Chloroflexota bacterium]
MKNGDFEHVAAWDSVSLITPKAAAFGAAVDARGEWHLAYVRTADEPGYPPGIYYTRSKSGGRYWTVPVLLYESDYLRGLGEGEANLSIVTAGTEDAPRVYLAWDNRPRKQVLLAQSADGGKSWEQPTLIAGPAPDSGLAGPFNIHVGANGNNAVLVWQDGQAGGTCSQSYQFSSDSGASWSAPQPMSEDLLGCAQSTEFVTGLANRPEGHLFLLTKSKGQVFLTPWNGRQWNQPQPQPILSGFEEPEIYTSVIYGCHRATLLGERLYVVGCDEGGGGDVWVTSRDLGTDSFRVEPPVWSQLSAVTGDDLEIEAIELVSTDDGLIHAFVSQHRDRLIYYTYWDGESWLQMTPVLKLPDGEAGRPAIAAGPRNELFLIAPNNRGALYFSRATSGDAAKESRWSSPTRLGIGHDGEIGSADVAWDAAGTIYVAYSVPVNERRGIYLVQSKDHGASWSEPLQVFNGAAAGFDLMGAPSLLISANGSLHVIWNVQSIQGYGIPQPLALYYTRSEDGGHTFNNAEQVVGEPVAWQEIATDGKGNLHLFWQPQEMVTTVWDQVSLDGGNSWQFPQGLPDKGRLATVTRDPVGRLHLVGPGSSTLDLWLWDGSHWQSEEFLQWSLTSQQAGPVELLAAAVNKDGEMVVVMVAPTGTGDAAERTLLYSTRTLKLPAVQAAIQEIPTQTPLPATSTPVIPTPELLLTPIASLDNGFANQGQTDHVETNEPIAPFTIALLPVALLLLSVLGIVIRQAAQVKDR